MRDDTTSMTLCCFLWARQGLASDMARYEDSVISLLVDHDAEIIQRLASDGADGHPHEVQIYRFPHQRALDGYLQDPRRQELSSERDRVIERTELFPVHAPVH